MRNSDFIHVNPKDTVVVALRNLDAGDLIKIGPETISVRTPIPAGHKLAIRELQKGQPVTKFGWPIGVAT
ncbi:MAG: UxaA family hydrolase, partial [Planctomycetota bacterium]